jgi:hypothetical protein
MHFIGMAATKPAHTAQRDLFRDERAHTSRSAQRAINSSGIDSRERAISIDRRFTRLQSG